MTRITAFSSYLLIIAVCSGAATISGARPQTAKPAQQPPEIARMEPTKDDVLRLVQSVIKAAEPKLEGENANAVNEMKFRLQSQKSSPAVLSETINEMVTRLTVSLAKLQSLDGIMVGSAYLVQYAPQNARTTNLFANTLHMAGRKRETAMVMGYTLSLQPGSTLAMLNLANALLDVDQDERAKQLIDKVLFEEMNNRDAYIALATYWYKKHDLRQQVDAMVKAAKLAYWVKKKTRKNVQKADENESKPGDSLPVLEAKAEQVKDLVPLTTADLIEENYPDIAAKIRAKYQRLLDSERMVLPLLPQMNFNTPKDYRRNQPIVDAWCEAVGSRLGQSQSELARMAGYIPGQSPAAKAKNQELAKQQTAAEMQKMLDSLKSIPGMDQAKVEEARKKLEQKMSNNKIPMQTPAENEAVPTLPEPGSLSSFWYRQDPASALTLVNYTNFAKVGRTLSDRLQKYFEDFDQKVGDIVAGYKTMVRDEDNLYAVNTAKLREEFQKAYADASTISGTAGIDRAVVGLKEKYALKLDAEALRHKKQINALGESHHKQWANLFAPEYTQKMKPKIEEYWRVCALYIRNMENPETMKSAYRNLLGGYAMYASKVVANFEVGKEFAYLGETAAEETQLQREIEAAQQLAKVKKPEFEQQTKSVVGALPQWVQDKMEFSVGMEFLSLMITPHAIEFGAYVPGVAGKAIYNFAENSLTTYTSLCAKLDIGVRAGPIDLKLQGEATMLESKTTFYFNNGKVVEASDRFASANAKLSAGPGGLSAIEGKFQLDPALSSELSGMVITTGLGQSKEYIF